MRAIRPNLVNVGEPAPWFICPAAMNDHFEFDTVAGRYIVLCFFRSAADPAAAKVLQDIAANRAPFDDTNACFFGVSIDPVDEKLNRIPDSIPGIRFFRDFDLNVSALYGVLQADGSYRPITYVLDPALRVAAFVPLAEPVENHVPALLGILKSLPALPPPYMAPAQAPVLVLPRVFEPKLCQLLIDYYESRGGEDSGFMRDLNGKTTKVIDYSHKRRRDCSIEDESLRQACMHRIHDRIGPEVQKAHQFRCTRIERFIIACYDAGEGGHFRAHRDNTTKGTAHRRFAVSLFLNSGEYEGGLLRFPEFGPGLYSAPVGGAVVFSCSFLHEATPVTRGRRYMFLPFLYDDAAREIREQNLQFVDSELSADAGNAADG